MDFPTFVETSNEFDDAIVEVVDRLGLIRVIETIRRVKSINRVTKDHEQFGPRMKMAKMSGSEHWLCTMGCRVTFRSLIHFFYQNQI